MLASGKENALSESKRIIEIVVVILLSIALQEFLSIITERVQTVLGFFAIISMVMLSYLVILYGLIFLPVEKTHCLIPRVFIGILFSLVPYTFLRTYGNLESVTSLTASGLWIYFFILSISLMIWGVWEKLNKKWYILADPRVVIGLLITAILILDSVGMIEVIK